MSTRNPYISRSSLIPPKASQRDGIEERRLLLPEESPYQSIVVVDAEYGSEVEMHEIFTSESLFVLRGAFEVLWPGSTELINAGDLCYFSPGTSHGLRCISESGQILIVFAPSRGDRRANVGEDRSDQETEKDRRNTFWSRQGTTRRAVSG